MASNHFAINKGITLRSQASAPSDPVNGDVYYDSTLTVFRFYQNGAWVNLSSGSASAVSISATAGENLSARDAVYVSIGSSDGSRTAGRVYKVDPTNDLRVRFIGFATASATTGNAVTIQIAGELSGFSSLTPGDFLWAHVSTPGSYQNSEPATVAQWKVPLGEVTSASTVLINAAGGATAQKVKLAFVEVTGTSQTIVAGNSYIANNAAVVTFTLPASSVVGDEFAIIGKGAGGWKIAQPGSQNIIKNNVASAPGAAGSLDSANPNDCVHLVCTTASTTWQVVDSDGAAVIASWDYPANTKMYFMGSRAGGTTTSTIYGLTVGESGANLGATLTTARAQGSGCSSPSAGYAIAGVDNGPTKLTSIDKLTFSSETVAALAGSISTANNYNGGCSSSSAGYAMGGEEASTVNKIYKVLYSTDAVSTLSATLPAVKDQMGGGTSTSKGYSLGGAANASGVGTNVIYSLTFSGETTTTLGATLPGARYAPGCFSSSAKAYVYSGYDAGNNPINTLNALTFSGETTASIGQTFDSANINAPNLPSSTTAGYGHRAVGSNSTSIDKLLFSTETKSTISATFGAGTANTMGVNY